MNAVDELFAVVAGRLSVIQGFDVKCRARCCCAAVTELVLGGPGV